MPIHELVCQSCGSRQERYLSRHDSPNPVCEIASCGGATERAISRFGIVWCGDMSRYNTRTEGMDPTTDLRNGSHLATAIRTPDGKPRTVVIDSIQKQNEFCRSEGLVPPKELGTNMEATSDKTLRERGMPGQWL